MSVAAVQEPGCVCSRRWVCAVCPQHNILKILCQYFFFKFINHQCDLVFFFCIQWLKSAFTIVTILFDPQLREFTFWFNVILKLQTSEVMWQR